MNGKWSFPTKRKEHWRLALIVLTTVLIALGHWWTPVAPDSLLGVHVLLRKSFLIPILLSAVWYNLRGAYLAALAVSLTYLPHVLLQWGSQSSEFVDQLGGFVTIWSTATLAGWLVGKEKAALQDLSETHEGALVALVMALDAREHDTKLHSLRVRAYARHLGKRMGLSPRNLLQLGEGALLHDIGKIGIPDQLLLKPGKLSEEEWTVMKTHPAIGADILDAVPFLSHASDVARSHHERFDGTGYPNGLRGEEIPIGGRIFAIVDVFDALTTDRPYHQKLSFRDARAQIRSGAGGHFDPAVVEAFLAVSVETWQRISDTVGLSTTEIQSR